MNKEISIFKNGVKLIRDLGIFISVIEKNKEIIFNKYHYLDISPCFQVKNNFTFKKTQKRMEINNILHGIDSIINFCNEKKLLIINLTSIV